MERKKRGWEGGKGWLMPLMFKIMKNSLDEKTISFIIL